MEPLTIAGLTVLALIALVLEYFTGLFRRGLAAAGRQTLSGDPAGSFAPIEAGQGEPSAGSDGPTTPEPMFRAAAQNASFLPRAADEPRNGSSVSAESSSALEAPRARVNRSTRSYPESSPPEQWENVPERRIGFRVEVSECRLDERAEQAYMPPGMRAVGMTTAVAPARVADRPEHPIERTPWSETSVAPPAPANGRAPVAARNSRASREASAEAQAASEVMRVVGKLLSVEQDLARDGYLGRVAAALDPLKELAIGYDLDNLMAISNQALNRDVIAYYREVLTMAAALDRHMRSTARIRALEHGDRLVEADRAALRDSVAAAVARGLGIARRLGEGAVQVSPGSGTDRRASPAPY